MPYQSASWRTHLTFRLRGDAVLQMARSAEWRGSRAQSHTSRSAQGAEGRRRFWTRRTKCPALPWARKSPVPRAGLRVRAVGLLPYSILKRDYPYLGTLDHLYRPALSHMAAWPPLKATATLVGINGNPMKQISVSSALGTPTLLLTTAVLRPRMSWTRTALVPTSDGILVSCLVTPYK